MAGALLGDAHLGGAGAHGVGQLLEVERRAHPHRHARVLATEAADQLRHRVGGEGGEAGEVEVSGHEPGDGGDGRGGVLDVAEGLPSRAQQRLAGHGEAWRRSATG